MPDFLENIYRTGNIAIDEYLSVNEQIQNQYSLKNMAPEIKLYMIMTKSIPDFSDVNFTKSQLAHAIGKTVQD